MKNTLQVIQMEKFVRQSLLYDFYGELLTQTQKSIYEDVVMNDLSYSGTGKGIWNLQTRRV